MQSRLGPARHISHPRLSSKTNRGRIVRNSGPGTNHFAPAPEKSRDDAAPSTSGRDELNDKAPDAKSWGAGATSRHVLNSMGEEDLFEDIGTAEFAHELSAHPVLRLLIQRAAQGSTPGSRKPGDTAKVGLVVEGGGMRGVISGAMLMALQALGLKDSFDVVYGASAGAINATYFLSEQRQGLNVYSEDLTGTRFINFGAVLRGGPAMDLDYLLHEVMRSIKPLDWRAVIDSPLPLKVVASSLDSLRPELLHDFSCDRDLTECLRASATVPQFAGPPREWRGHRLVDAAVFEPVPLRSALRDGCTHVLVLCTRPAQLHTTWRRAVRGTVVRVVKRTVLNAPYMRAAWASQGASGDDLAAQDAELVSTLAVPPEATRAAMGAYVLPLYPQTSGGAHPVCTNARVLKAAEAEGWRAVASLFGATDLLLDLGLSPGDLVPGSMDGSRVASRR